MSDADMNPASADPRSAYTPVGSDAYLASPLTRGPWHPDHQHAGPPTALVCRAVEQAAAAQGYTHVSRLTANLLRPVPIGELTIEVAPDYDETPVVAHMKGREIHIEVDLGLGRGKSTVWTCDLTHGYIDINADYRS